MKIIKTSDLRLEKIIALASKILKSGGMIIYPTETCYGIGVDSTNIVAVEKLLKYKGDRKGKPISVAVADKKMAEDYIDFNPQAENLFNNFLPGPITVVCQGKHRVVNKLESEKGKLGIRFPNHKLALKIIQTFGKPITSTSANVSHGKTPYDIQKDIVDRISNSKKELIDLIIDAGKLPYHPPSTIVDTTLNNPKILRQGEFILPSRKMKSFFTNNEDETISLAEKFTNSQIKKLRQKCLIFDLQGNLGAGKTQFAKGVAKALGIYAKIKSPTFTLCHEYDFVNKTQKNKIATKNKMYHIDTWRMTEEYELWDIGFQKMLHHGNVVLIEWGEKIFEILREVKKRKDVKIVKIKITAENKNKRKIIIL